MGVEVHVLTAENFLQNCYSIKETISQHAAKTIFGLLTNHYLSVYIKQYHIVLH